MKMTLISGDIVMLGISFVNVVVGEVMISGW